MFNGGYEKNLSNPKYMQYIASISMFWIHEGIMSQLKKVSFVSTTKERY